VAEEGAVLLVDEMSGRLIVREKLKQSAGQQALVGSLHLNLGGNLCGKDSGIPLELVICRK
jgi:hypothetical protein